MNIGNGLKAIINVEELFFHKLEELFSSNSNLRYYLIRLLKSNHILTTTQFNTHLQKWNIEIDYDIESISIQQIIDYLQ